MRIDVTNAVPVARNDSYTWAGGTLTVSAPGVLANDSDADGDALTAELVGGGVSGSLDLDPDGGFQLHPGGGFGSSGSFKYRVSDGKGWSPPVTVTLTIAAATPSQPRRQLRDPRPRPPRGRCRACRCPRSRCRACTAVDSAAQRARPAAHTTSDPRAVNPEPAGKHATNARAFHAALSLGKP